MSQERATVKSQFVCKKKKKKLTPIGFMREEKTFCFISIVIAESECHKTRDKTLKDHFLVVTLRTTSDAAVRKVEWPLSRIGIDVNGRDCIGSQKFIMKLGASDRR